MSEPLTLAVQLEQLRTFMKGLDDSESGSPKIRDTSADGTMREIRRCLGWMAHECKPAVPLKNLYLNLIVPGSGLVDGTPQSVEHIQALLKSVRRYLAWHKERGTSASSMVVFLAACIWVAKFLYHDQSKTSIFFGSSSARTTRYRDIPVIEALRQLQTVKSKEAGREPPVADESKKWLDWRDFLMVVEQLRQECNPIGSNGCRRSDRAIAASYQRFLIFAILSGFPDRQRTIRELANGKTLVKRKEFWRVEHKPSDIKVPAFAENGDRIVPLPDWIYAELEAWLFGFEDADGHWQGWISPDGKRQGGRAALAPKHNFVFSQKNGKPLTDTSLYSLFRTAAYRLTGQACNPHLIRDMIVTSLMEQGAPEHMMAALAYLMAHSSHTQKKSYDRRSKQKKMQPAMDVLADLRAKARKDLAS